MTSTAPHPRLLWLRDVLPPPWGGELAALLASPDIATAEDMRLRVGTPLTLRLGDRVCRGHMPLTPTVLGDLLLRLADGGLYAHRETICRGYITLADGCRVGVCGRATVEDGVVTAVSDVCSLCLRLAAPLPPSARALAGTVADLIPRDVGRSLLILAPPGAGKTTLLRALALTLAQRGRQVAVVDTRGELTPALARSGTSLDLLTGYPRRAGIDIALRTLGAEVILCDEIGDADDASALLAAQACGVPLVATAHGCDPAAVAERPSLSPLFAGGMFGAVVCLARVPGRAPTMRVVEL